MNNNKKSNFMIWVVIGLIVVFLGAYFGIKLLSYDGEINKANGYYLVERNEKDILIKVKDTKYKIVNEFESKDLLFLGEYNNNYYYASGTKIIYYSFNDNMEHVWLTLDKDHCSTLDEDIQKMCAIIYTITQGTIVEDTLYYHISSAAVGNNANYLFKIKLNATSIDEKVVIVPHVVTAWQFNDAKTKIFFQAHLVTNDEIDFDHKTDLQYDVATGVSTKINFNKEENDEFDSSDLLFLGEYNNGNYYVSETSIIYYSFNDNKEHLWLKVDDGYCSTLGNEAGMCEMLYTISEGKIIGDTLYYHITSAAVGDEANYLFKIKLNATSIEEKVAIVPHAVVEWKFNSTKTKILCKAHLITNGEMDFDNTTNLQYDITSGILTQE